VHNHRAGGLIRLIRADVLIQDLKRIFAMVVALSTLIRAQHIYNVSGHLPSKLRHPSKHTLKLLCSRLDFLPLASPPFCLICLRY
jgi:hypothetical protein